MPRVRAPVLVGLGVSLTTMATSTFATLSLGALAPYVRAAFRFSTFEVGLLPALVFAGALVASVPAGHLTDRLGAGPALVVSQLGIAAGIGLAALTSSRGWFLTGVWIAGLGYGAVNPATNVLSTSLVPRNRRALFLSVKQTGVPLGGLIAGATLPRLADSLGWRAALAVAVGVLLFTSLVGLWVARREALGWFEQLALPRSDASPTPAPGVLVPGGISTAMFGFVMSGVQYSLAGYLTVYLVDEHGFSKPTAGLALSVAFGAACLGRVIWGWLSDRCFASHASTLVFASAGSLTALVAFTTGVSGPSLWLVIMVIGICSIGWNGVYMALIIDRATAGRLGQATGRGLLFIYGGVVFLPPLLGVLNDATGSWSTMWAAATGAVLLAGGALALSPRRLVGAGSSEATRTEPKVGFPA
ncbi:MAG: MFS transporter [Solirubrobacterales bacterium]|nr:MFS transporter [Solirubrobacterales bacterium]